ncbi:MAG: hypothetical protein ACREHG_02820 [Candidatus Saccharimonadales bacterium]
MNTNQLLQHLADKLGTTVQHLWMVLIHQAFINGLENLIVFIVVSLLGVVLWKLCKRGTQPVTPDDTCHTESYFEENIAVAVFVYLGLIVWCGLFVWSIVLIGDTINSFCDPQYWALNQIFQVINH